MSTLKHIALRTSRSIRNNIMVGLVLVIPIVVTGFIINIVFGFLTGRLLPASLKGGEHELLFRTVALLIVLAVLFLVGLFTRNIVGRKLYQLGDYILTHVPVINKIYVSVRQMSAALLAQRQTMFKNVVLVEYPRHGLYSVAFVTGTVPADVAGSMGYPPEKEIVSLFLPTTPNPTSGLLIFSPREDLVALPISVADAMKLIISAGAAFPGSEIPDTGENLLEQINRFINDGEKTPPPNPEQQSRT